MKATLIRLGIRGFNPKLKKAAGRLEDLRTPEGEPIPPNTMAELQLAENGLKPWRKDMWCIPQVDGEYVARMEDVLDLYAEEPNPKCPVVCFDESPNPAHRRGAPADPGRAWPDRTLRLRV